MKYVPSTLPSSYVARRWRGGGSSRAAPRARTSAQALVGSSATCGSRRLSATGLREALDPRQLGAMHGGHAADPELLVDDVGSKRRARRRHLPPMVCDPRVVRCLPALVLFAACGPKPPPAGWAEREVHGERHETRAGFCSARARRPDEARRCDDRRARRGDREGRARPARRSGTRRRASRCGRPGSRTTAATTSRRARCWHVRHRPATRPRSTGSSPRSAASWRSRRSIRR